VQIFGTVLNGPDIFAAEYRTLNSAKKFVSTRYNFRFCKISKFNVLCVSNALKISRKKSVRQFSKAYEKKKCPKNCVIVVNSEIFNENPKRSSETLVISTRARPDNFMRRVIYIYGKSVITIFVSRPSKCSEIRSFQEF